VMALCRGVALFSFPASVIASLSPNVAVVSGPARFDEIVPFNGVLNWLDLSINE
jgi:hypothetical protein